MSRFCFVVGLVKPRGEALPFKVYEIFGEQKDFQESRWIFTSTIGFPGISMDFLSTIGFSGMCTRFEEVICSSGKFVNKLKSTQTYLFLSQLLSFSGLFLSPLASNLNNRRSGVDFHLI